MLIGGGHANVQVLRELCMKEYKDLNVILISEDYGAIYSGMTPGYIRKVYSIDEITIDLQRLCFNAGATFIRDEVVSLDEEKQIVILKDNPSISFDVLSINSGSISNNLTVQINDDSKVISVKPINSFVSKISLIDDVIKKSSQRKISIVGGGVAAFELGFALFERYDGNISIDIICQEHLVEKNLNISSIQKLKKIAKNLGINLISNKVTAINESEIKLDNGDKIKSDLILLSTGAVLPDWLTKSSLRKTDHFVATNNLLQSLNYQNIFISGDAAEIKDNKRPKSGVMAVRQGEILKKNLFLYLQKKPLKKFKPNKNWLYLIGTNKNTAILNYFYLSFEMNWCWSLKKIIDFNFINKFSFFGKTNMNKKEFYLNKPKHNHPKMYCQGCGSKVSKKSLVSYLSENHSNAKLDDSTVLKLDKKELLQTIDHIKLFKSFNPYIFGKISYLHSQNDILSCGGIVNSINVSVGIPFSENKSEKFFLDYFMKGIQSESHKDDSLITAGHSYQTNEPGITIHMNGYIKKNLNKSLAKDNSLIYLSKPLGTGYLLSAYLQNTSLIPSQEFKKIIDYMLLSNKEAASVAIDTNCNVITDISGFGLASHLGDICESSRLSASISISKKLLINDNLDLLEKFESTGFKNNYLSSIEKINYEEYRRELKILFDPQTNGPLIMIIDQDSKENFEKTFKKKLKRAPILIGNLTKKQNTLINII